MLMEAKTDKPEEKEIICRKCNAVYYFWWTVFLVVLFIMLMCLFVLDLWSVWVNSIIQFFFLVELIVAIAIFEEYMNILVIWKDVIRFESWILVKNKKEIPYDKINSVNVHSVFWLGTLEIMTGNDEVTRYKFLHKYEEVEKIIKERIHKDK
jgi:membrane protein YdbS with pleckstrin-like domain